MTTRLYANNISTTLSAAITSTSATTLTVASPAGLPAITGSNYFLMTIDDSTNIEIVKVTAISGSTLTIVRAQESTTASTFANNTPIELRDTATSFSNAIANQGVTASVTELNYVAGVTSAIQTQLGTKVSLDSNSNITANNFVPSYATNVTASITTTLTVASAEIQTFTGTQTQVVGMPDVTTLGLGQNWTIINKSTGALTVESSLGNTINTIAGGDSAIYVCNSLTGNTAASWTYVYVPAAGGSGVTYSTVSGTSQAAAVNSGYIANNSSLVTITLPATAAIGSTVEVMGLGSGGWQLSAHSGQTIKLSSATTSSGGSLASRKQYDTIVVKCIVANTTWAVIPASSGYILL